MFVCVCVCVCVCTGKTKGPIDENKFFLLTYMVDVLMTGWWPISGA